jgi:signal transduction histidine kinase/DNA-binding response OmpR family regulator
LEARPAQAAPDPKTAVVSASPDSALVHLTAARVRSKAMQRLGGNVRWRYRPGRPPGWASPATNDLDWLLASSGFLFNEGPPGWQGTGCFRIRFTLDSALLGQALGLHILQEGAMDVYLDGQLLGRYGTVGPSAQTTRSMRPRYLMLPLVLREAGPHLLAVRFAKFDFWPPPYGGFAVWVAPAERLLADRVTTARLDAFNLVGFTGYGVLALLHFFLFLFYRSQRANLYFSLFMSMAATTSLMVYFRATLMDAEARWWAVLGFQAAMSVCNVLLLAFIYSVCRTRLSWLWLGFQLLVSSAQIGLWLMKPFTSGNQVAPVLGPLFLLAWVDMLRVLGRAMWRRQPGIWLIGLGTLGTMLVPFAAGSLFAAFFPAGDYDYTAHQVFIQACALVLPICMSVYLARDFAATRRSLEVQLRQVEQLSAQALAQEAERRRLISAQNERLEVTVQARTEQIIEQNHALEAQRDEITAQADRLRAMDREKTRFFTNITHEFRTPLTLILGPAEQIAANTHEPTTRQQAQLVHRNAERLLHLINQLLDLSRLEAGQQTLHPAPGEVVGFLRGLVGSFEALAQQRGIACSFEATRSALWVKFDADNLEKVVVNLLANAFKFTPSAGQVAVKVSVADAPEPGAPVWLELTVQDTGRGIAPAQLPHVFDRFYQADSSTTREQEGTGIGLSLTKELVDLHGGTIAVSSELGRGTTVVVRLPLPVAEAAAPDAATPVTPHLPLIVPPEPTTPAEPEPAETTAPEVPLVLLIEDNADVRAYLHAALANDYCLLEAKDGAEGVAAAREHLPDLVLTDTMMPRLDGYGVCRALKQDERTSHIPIVMLTAKADLPSKLQGLDTGADAYLTKPFHREELLAQLRNLVHGRQQLQEAYRRGLALPPPPGPPTMEEVFLARVRHAVEEALHDETLGVESLGRALALSRTQLHRKLKALTGQAPGDFIRLIRLQRAHELLAAGVATVAEVAYQVGYGNPSNFSTSFSRHFGYAPSEARRRQVAAG